MKKWILIGLLGVIGLAVFAGLFGWLSTDKNTDPVSTAEQDGSSNAKAPDPESVDAPNNVDEFKKQFAESCVQSAEAAAGAMDDATKEKLADMCACGAKATYEAFKDEPSVKLLSVSADSETGKQIAAIMQDCAKEAGF